MNNLLSCHYNMDTNRVEAQFADGSAVAIDCIAIEDEYGNTPAQRAELDWLLYGNHQPRSADKRCLLKILISEENKKWGCCTYRYCLWL